MGGYRAKGNQIITCETELFIIPAINLIRNPQIKMINRNVITVPLFSYKKLIMKTRDPLIQY